VDDDWWNRERAALRALTDAEKREEQRAARDRLRRERWGDDAEQAMTRLAHAFPSLRGAHGLAPWNDGVFLLWARAHATSGAAAHAAAFVLQVWQRDTDWREHGLRGFNVVAAIAEWDDDHAEAFHAWCRAPFFADCGSVVG
jgi:hypothetical protein